MNYPVIIFDWDGTLVDSEAHIVACIAYAAKKVGMPALSYDETKSIIGLGIVEALQKLYPSINDDQVVAMREAYKEHFFAKGTSTRDDLFIGVWETLTELKRRGHRLAVATGKSRNGLAQSLVSTELGEFFEIERCADETKSKPHPLMLIEIARYFNTHYENILMVGDTTFDLDMAAAVDMPSVGVSYGVHDVEALKLSNPIAIIDRFEQLLEWA